MEQLPGRYTQGEPNSLAAGVPPLLDQRHLLRQTLGDAALKAVVLGLFLDEAPGYAANIVTAPDAKAWRMSVHTLKGVALNLGAFRLAQLCRQHEAMGFGLVDTAELTALIAATAGVIRRELA